MKGLLPEPFRLKPRTGLLNTFFEAGYAREFKSMRHILLSRRATWAEYVDRKWLVNALEKSSLSDKEKMLVWYCAAYELWQRAISGDAPELLQFANSRP
jgi:hypothetical protein